MVQFVWLNMVMSKNSASIWICAGNLSKTTLILTFWSSCLSLLKSISLSPCLFSRIHWANASADGVCDFSSAPSSRRAGSPSQVPSSDIFPAFPLPPHGVRGGENYIRLCADYTHTIITYVTYFTPYGVRGGVWIQSSSVTYDLALDPGFLPLVCNAVVINV